MVYGLWTMLAGVAVGLLLLWLALVITRVVTRPADPNVVDILRLLLVYLIMPIDLIPDFIPVIGYADDAIIVAVALRSVARRAGPDALQRHWPGTPDGLQAVRRLSGIRDPDT